MVLHKSTEPAFSTVWFVCIVELYTVGVTEFLFTNL